MLQTRTDRLLAASCLERSPRVGVNKSSLGVLELFEAGGDHPGLAWLAADLDWVLSIRMSWAPHRPLA